MVERIIIALIQWHYRIVSCIQIIPTETLKEQTEKKQCLQRTIDTFNMFKQRTCMFHARVITRTLS